MLAARVSTASFETNPGWWTPPGTRTGPSQPFSPSRAGPSSSRSCSRSFAFPETKDQTWGLNLERVIKRKNDLDYWAAWNRNFAFTHVSQAGQLTGLSGIRQAERLRIRPYVVVGAEKLDATASPLGVQGLGEVGLDDLKIGVTSSLTADFAVNPDFAQAEVDAQRVNLTRFSLFFPERRQFFIEGSDSLRMGVDTLASGRASSWCTHAASGFRSVASRSRSWPAAS